MFALKLRCIAVAAVGAVAVAAPSGASAATPIPPLGAGNVQAYAALTATGPSIAAPITRSFSGSVTFSGGETCVAAWTIAFATDGTAQVTNATFAACTTGVPGCNASVASSNLSWGSRLVRDSGGAFRQRVNVQLVRTFSGTCPFPPASYAYSGTLSPRMTGGTPASATFDAGSGSLSNALGPVTLSGTLTGAAGQATYFRV